MSRNSQISKQNYYFERRLNHHRSVNFLKDFVVVVLVIYWVTEIVVFSMFIKLLKASVFAPAGFWPRGQNPRRHPRSPRMYTYKNKEYLLKK